MTETTIELEIPLLLPGIQDDRDDCLKRLEAALQDRKGISRSHLELEKSPVQLCLHYDPAVVSMEDVRRLAERSGAGIIGRYHHERVPIEGMDCSDCAVVLEHSLSRMDGVLSISVNYAAQLMQLELDSRQTSRRAIEKRVRQLGYRVPVEGARNWYEDNRELLFSLAGGLLLLAGWLGTGSFGISSGVGTGMLLAASAIAGYDITRHAVHALRERHLDTDLLMVLAALGAAALGQFAEAALLLFLFSLGHALEERVLDRARDAIRALADLAPKTAIVRRDGAELDLPIGEIQLEEVVVVRPGVRIPVDGEVLTGESSVDQSPVTGESLPVDKSPGEAVYAGSVNGEGALEVRVSKLARDSTLARVVDMVERAQAQKSPTQQGTERFSRVFVPVVLVADVLLIVVPPLFGVPFADSFLRAMTLLVAASPCALALGTPSAILAGIAQAARNGVLIKGGVHLENLGRLRAIAFDKTGTLTRGEPQVTDVLAFGSRQENAVLALAAAAESRSAHPLAQAVVRGAEARGLQLPPVAEAEALTGRGIKAEIEGKWVRIGNRKLFEAEGMVLARSILQPIEALEEQGKTVMLVGEDREILGAIAVADVVRKDALLAVATLARLGLKETIMLTGDNVRAAAHIADQVGLTNYRADLMPEDKLRVIEELVQAYDVAGMVGDGVNDAPALASATVGIAMGGAGTDVALETADVALMADDLGKLPFAVGLGRATLAIIRQNLFISLSVTAILIVLALSGLASIGLAIVFHEGSTLLVVFNALRLLSFRATSSETVRA